MLGALLLTLCPAGSFAPSSLLRVPPAVRRLPWLSDIFLNTGLFRMLIISLLGALHPFGALLAARHPRGHSALPGYSASSWLLVLGALRHPLVTRRFPVCPNPLACRYPQWTSWSLLALLAAWQLPSGWHLLGTYFTVWRSPGCSAYSWPLTATLASLHPHGCSMSY